jgi:sugar phosphate isomerase/epimerase
MTKSESKHICIFSKHLHWLNYTDMAALAAEIGFSGIDLTVRNKGHVLPERVKNDLPEAVEAIRNAGLEVPMITTGILDPDDRLTRDILETAGALGINYYRTGWYKYEEGTPVKVQLDRAWQKMSGLQEINKSCKIAAAYQNHAGSSLGGSGWDLLHIIEGLDPQWTGVQFDIRHAMVEGPKTWPYVFEMLAPYINTVDIKDYTWKTVDQVARVVNVPLGQGQVDFDLYINKLRQFNVLTDASIHYEYPLGGAEHGTTELEISKEKFVAMVRADLNFLKARLST